MPWYRRGVRSALAIVALLVACGDPSNTQKLPVGSRCSSSSQCGTPPFDCAAVGYPGGYCEKPCTTHGDCPADSLCSPALHQCRRRCASNKDCRVDEGYGCRTIGGTDAVCEAGPPLDGGQPSG